MKYQEFFKFLESKDRFIDNNVNLTPDQKVEIKSFFAKHPNYESRIDWNKARSLTYDDFKPILNLEGKSVSAVKKGAGIQGLTEGHDYILLGKGVFNGEEWYAYQPLTYYASRLIASRFVKPEVDAKWCTAYQQDRCYWDKHAFENKESFIYLCGNSIPTGKVAITASTLKKDSDKQGYLYHLESGLNFNIWNANDSKVKILKSLPKEVVSLIPKSYENRDLVIQLHDEDVRKTEEIKRQEEERIKRLKTPKLNSVTGRYDVAMSLDHDDVLQYVENGKFRIPFGVVKGDFNCSFCRDLTSLEDAPREVGGDFCCENCTSLKSLEGGPERVDGNFNCSKCENLSSLEGAPKYVGKNFYCSDCDRLSSLEGAPEYVGRSFDCRYCWNLTSLEGIPKKIDGDFICCNCYKLTSLGSSSEIVLLGDFNCSECRKLTSLKGAPGKVDGDFICSKCENLSSLEGAPEYVGRSFDCRYCPLESLKGSPEYVGDSFYCDFCKNLTSLEGAPKKVGGNFRCSFCNNLTSLKGAPREVGGWFDCSYFNKLTSLEGAPEYVGGDFRCGDCGREFTEDEVRAICNVRGSMRC